MNAKTTFEMVILEFRKRAALLTVLSIKLGLWMFMSVIYIFIMFLFAQTVLF
jgi:hypothetical protein